MDFRELPGNGKVCEFPDRVQPGSFRPRSSRSRTGPYNSWTQSGSTRTRSWRRRAVQNCMLRDPGPNPGAPRPGPEVSGFAFKLGRSARPHKQTSKRANEAIASIHPNKQASTHTRTRTNTQANERTNAKTNKHTNKEPRKQARSHAHSQARTCINFRISPVSGLSLALGCTNGPCHRSCV